MIHDNKNKIKSINKKVKFDSDIEESESESEVESDVKSELKPKKN